ncbi:MAG: phosphotransferase [Sphingopyxis sp.]|nr:phosphotransferase [Sphingopyxis sp.]
MADRHGNDALIEPRTAVLWNGDPPPSDVVDALRTRGLLAEPLSTVGPDDLNKACATVFWADGKTASQIIVGVKGFAKDCVSHGHSVIVRCDEAVCKIVRSLPGSEHWQFVSLDIDCQILAEHLRKGLVEAGPPATGPEPEGELDLSPEDLILFRRAFWDCDIARVKEMKEGRSSARVFRVHARRKNKQPPGYLLPFLVKIDTKEEIEKEKKNYINFVEGHVPFTQRPNFSAARSISTPTRAIMVSDFVDEAHSLVEVCRRPESRDVLYSLFDDALRSWRRDAFRGDVDPPVLPITTYLRSVVKPAEILPQVLAKGGRLGLKATADDLLDRLEAVSVFPYRIGTIHGDLHPGNVMVRRQEAILIDFALVWDKRPIIADLACLEVAACFTVASDAVSRSDKQLNRAEYLIWKDELRKLFDCKCLNHVPPLQEPGPRDWLWTLCRQTRSMADQTDASKAAYASALVIYLLRRARLSTPSEHPAIGAHALVIAENIVEGLEKGRI